MIVFNIGPIEALLLLVVFLVCTGVPIWGIVDAARRPDKRWEAVASSKALWIALMAAGAVFCAPVGLAVTLYYLLVMRPKLDAASEAGSF
jgi:hypothetical protein